MDIDPSTLSQGLFRQLLPLLFSLLDDALVLGLSRLGCHVSWLKWLSPVILSCTFVYFAIQVWQHRYWFRKLNFLSKG